MICNCLFRLTKKKVDIEFISLQIPKSPLRANQGLSRGAAHRHREDEHLAAVPPPTVGQEGGAATATPQEEGGVGDHRGRRAGGRSGEGHGGGIYLQIRLS